MMAIGARQQVPPLLLEKLIANQLKTIISITIYSINYLYCK